MTESAPLLTAAFGRHPIGQLLRSGEVDDPRVRLDHQEIAPIHKAFAPMVTEQNVDLSEMAIVTGLQAIAYGHDITLLPAVVAARFQRACLVTRASDPITPAELKGHAVGVRAYTQTTGFWVRTHLAEDFGIQASDITWITQNPAHVPEYEDPEFVARTLTGTLSEALRAGTIDAAIFGNDKPTDGEFVDVITDAHQRDQAWFDAHGYAPINHLVAVARPVIDTYPDAVLGALGMLEKAETLAADRTDSARLTMTGLDRLVGPVEDLARSCYDQGMLPKPLTVEEIFGPVMALLTAPE